MSQDKDYSLLRPFNAEAAKRGEPICSGIYGEGVLWSYVAGPDEREKYVLRIENGGSRGEFTSPTSTFPLRMAPLAWVEGKPVYKGDVLYCADKHVVARDKVDEVGWMTCADGIHRNAHTMTWTPPATTSPSPALPPRGLVFAAINAERDFQDAKWGTIQQNPHEVGSWLTIMRHLLTEASRAYISQHGDKGALDELRKVVAVGVACMEQHGVVARVAKDAA